MKQKYNIKSNADQKQTNKDQLIAKISWSKRLQMFCYGWCEWERELVDGLKRISCLFIQYIAVLL